MNREEMKTRTKQFALRVIRLVEVLPASRAADVIGKQLLRAGTSVGANYRAACRARSKAEFIASWVSLKRKLTSVPTGWNCSLRLA